MSSSSDIYVAPVESMLADASVGAATRDTLRVVHNNAVRLLQMINGLLDFSKFSAQRMEIRREPLDIVPLTRSLLWDFRSAMQKKGLPDSFTTDVAPNRGAPGWAWPW